MHSRFGRGATSPPPLPLIDRLAARTGCAVHASNCLAARTSCAAHFFSFLRSCGDVTFLCVGPPYERNIRRYHVKKPQHSSKQGLYYFNLCIPRLSFPEVLIFSLMFSQDLFTSSSQFKFCKAVNLFTVCATYSVISHVKCVLYLYISTVVKALCYKSEGRWFDPSWCHCNFSLT